MGRTRLAITLDKVGRAGLVVFARSGFRQAQMVDAARELGVALGTLYSYVESKEALFGLAVDSLFVENWSHTATPVPTPEPSELLALTRRRLAEAMVLPILAAAMTHRRARDPHAELTGVLGELWDLTLATRLGADMIERSTRDWPELSELFYTEARRKLFDRLAAYFEQRSNVGQFRPFVDPALTARAAHETVTWWARHRFDDPDADTVDDRHARDTVLPWLLDATLQPQ